MKNPLFTLLALSLLSGCSLIPVYERPAVDTAAQWSQPSAPDSSAIARNWWTSFGSKELDGLMDQALANNNDLRASLQRIAQARAFLKISNSSLLPTLDANASAGREHRTRPDSTDTELRAGLGAAYELDLFGANRSDVTASEANLAATGFDHEALKLVVMADVATSYFNVLNGRERLRIADGNLKNSHEVLRIVQARYEAGASDALEVSQQKSQLASTEAARASVAQSVENAENALAVLVGKAPKSITVTADNLNDLKVPAIAAGQPSALLERRPDIKAAEADLLAANADIGAARAALFPSVTLGLDWSLATSGFGDPASTALGLTSSLLAPIFEGGRLQAGVEQAQARELELAETYRKTILVSFQDVEDSLSAVKTAQLRETALQTAMEEARKSYELSRSRYDAGTIDFQTLLDSQRTSLIADDTFAQSKNERLAAAVNLFKALGGGWAQDVPPAQPAPLPAAVPVAPVPPAQTPPLPPPSKT